jgi:hypothetical protein
VWGEPHRRKTAGPEKKYEKEVAQFSTIKWSTFGSSLFRDSCRVAQFSIVKWITFRLTNTPEFDILKVSQLAFKMMIEN